MSYAPPDTSTEPPPPPVSHSKTRKKFRADVHEHQGKLAKITLETMHFAFGYQAASELNSPSARLLGLLHDGDRCLAEAQILHRRSVKMKEILRTEGRVIAVLRMWLRIRRQELMIDGNCRWNSTPLDLI